MPQSPVSILIPTFNCIEFIPSLIKTFSEFKKSNYTIIILDNHSTDGTYEALYNHIDKFPSTRLYRQEINVGAIRNFSDLFSLADSKYSALWPVGDSRNPNFVSQMVNELERYPHAGLCIPTIEVSLPDKTKVFEVQMDRNLTSGNLAAKYKHSLYNLPGTAIYGIYKTSIVKQVLPIPIMRGGDICFLRRIYSISDVIFCKESRFYFTTRYRYNSFQEDTNFFFGDTKESEYVKSKFPYETLNMLRQDSLWFKQVLTTNLYQRMRIIIIQLEFLLRRSLLKITVYGLKKLFRGRSLRYILCWYYFTFCKPSFIKNPNFPIFYSREILPQLGLHEDV